MSEVAQERMKDSQRQLEEVTRKMAKLAQEKAELESRNRILEHVVRLNVDHVEELSSNQVGSTPIPHGVTWHQDQGHEEAPCALMWQCR